MLKCTSLSRHVCGARSSPYASYLTVYKRGERNECGFETRPLESWMMGSWLRDWQEKERFTRNEEKKIQRYRILVFRRLGVDLTFFVGIFCDMLDHVIVPRGQFLSKQVSSWSHLQIFKLIKCKWLPGECTDWFFDNIMTWSYCLHRWYSMSRQKNSILINEHALNFEPVPLTPDLFLSAGSFTLRIFFLFLVLKYITNWSWY